MLRLLFSWIGRGSGLESLRDGLAHSFEEISDRVGVYAWSAEKEQRSG
jgi:hypothetical protein